MYNYIVADVENRLKENAWELKEVEVKTPEGFEKREVKTLSSQIKQGIIERIKRFLKDLKRAKERASSQPEQFVTYGFHGKILFEVSNTLDLYIFLFFISCDRILLELRS